MPSEASVLLTRNDRVLTLRLNRPERRNALTTSMLTCLADHLLSAEQDPDIHAVVIAGSDTVFAAGSDIDELATATGSDSVESPRFLSWQAIRNFPKPLIAAVEGWCLGGGCELMMCCDIAIAGDGASFGQPETNLGIIPGAGGTATLARLIGRTRAMRMVLTGESISAEEAAAIGLITTVVRPGQARAEALTLATTIAARAPLALRAAKASIKDATSLTETDHIRQERRRFMELLDTADKAEGLASFRERRAALWKGN